MATENAPAQTSSVSTGRRNWLTAIALLALAWCLYLPTLRCDFICYDDVRVLKNHPELYGAATLGADLRAIFVTEFPREEPLLVRDVTWAIDSHLFGFGNPFGYHLGNLILHGVVVALLFVFLLQTTRRYSFALAVALAYTLLAIHVEPVAWIMGRKDLLSATFMLLALLAQNQRLAAGNFTGQIGWYAITLLSFAAGLLSKINVLTFPLVLWLHALLLPYLNGDLRPSQPFHRFSAVLRESFLVVPPLLLSGAIYFWYSRTIEQMGVLERGYTAHGLAHLWNLLMVNPLGFWFYLRQIVFPLHLAVQYSWPHLETSGYPAWQVFVALGTVTGLLATGLWLFFRRKDLFFYFAAFFALMIPYLNLIFIGIWVADRYVYFSVFCILAMATSVAGQIWQQSTRLGRAALMIAAGVLLVHNLGQSLAYQVVWQNAETLWQYHLSLPTHSARDYDNLAASYYSDFSDALGRQDTAHAATALSKMKVVVRAGLNEYWPNQKLPPPPSTAFLFFLQSLIEEVEGQPEAALRSLLTSDHLHPAFDSTVLNLSRLYRKLADAAVNSQSRAVNLQAARDRFAQYLHIVYRDRPAPANLRREMADLDAACAALPTIQNPPAQDGH